MPALPCVVIYGNTLALAGIAIAMRDRRDLQVVSLLAGGPGDEAILDSFHPDVILFDQSQAGVQLFLPRLKQHAGLVLIGVDANENLLSVWSGWQERALTIEDLLKTISKITTIPPEEKGLPDETRHSPG